MGDLKQRATALNSKSILLLRDNKPADALTSLKQVDSTAIEGSNRLGYRYNLARALELNGAQYSHESYTEYLKILKERPGYGPAQDGVFRVLFHEPVARIDDAAAIGTELLATGQRESSAYYMRKSLERWATQPDAQKLLAVLLHYYATEPVNTEQFKKAEWAWLQKTGGIHRA